MLGFVTVATHSDLHVVTLGSAVNGLSFRRSCFRAYIPRGNNSLLAHYLDAREHQSLIKVSPTCNRVTFIGRRITLPLHLVEELCLSDFASDYLSLSQSCLIGLRTISLLFLTVSVTKPLRADRCRPSQSVIGQSHHSIRGLSGMRARNTFRFPSVCWSRVGRTGLYRVELNFAVKGDQQEAKPRLNSPLLSNTTSLNRAHQIGFTIRGV